MKLSLLIFLIFFTSAISAFGQTGSCSKTTEGTDFWFGFMEGRHHQPEHRTEITLTSLYDCSFTIYIGNEYYSSGQVVKNIPLQITIPWGMVEAIGSEIIPFEKKAIHLVSSLPINVYALNYASASADVALIFPTASLGNEYYAMCYTPMYSIAGLGPTLNSKNSEFLIVASVDNSTVIITPYVVTDGGKNQGIPFSITLNKGEMYQVQSENLPNLPGQGDLTGSHIISDQPIAVFFWLIFNKYSQWSLLL